MEEDDFDGGSMATDKFLAIKFPKQLLQEVDDLCAFNLMERSEFINIAIEQLLDCLDRQIGRKAWQEEDAMPSYDAEPDGDLLAADEDGEDDLL